MGSRKLQTRGRLSIQRGPMDKVLPSCQTKPDETVSPYVEHHEMKTPKTPSKDDLYELLRSHSQSSSLSSAFFASFGLLGA